MSNPLRPLEGPKVSAVVPTTGASSWLEECLRALREDGGGELEIVVVDQAPVEVSLPEGLTDTVLRPGRNLGFAAATNLGIQTAQGELVATVNDDAIVEAGWFCRLLESFDGDPSLGAAQGLNYDLRAPSRVDGAGVAFNRWWQAVQLGHGEDCERWTGPESSVEIFGVSATAAVYRRSALNEVALANGDIFDSALESYYEDVDLACRLRGAGFHAYRVAEARAGHAGSVTGSRRPMRRQALIYGNRYLVLARALGRRFWSRFPRVLLRDVLDLLQSLLRARLGACLGILRGWGRAARLLPRFARLGPSWPSGELVSTPTGAVPTGPPSSGRAGSPEAKP